MSEAAAEAVATGAGGDSGAAAEANPQIGESVMQTLARLEAAGAGAEFAESSPGAESGEGGSAEPEAEAKATEKSKSSGKADSDGEEASATPAAEPGKPSAEFLAEAERLGLAIDDKGRVANGERKKFREYKEAERAKLDQRAREISEKLETARTDLRNDLVFANAVRAAREARDETALAKLLGFEDFDAYQQDLINHKADPNHRRLMELERQLQEKQRKEAEAEAARQRQEMTAQQRAAEDKYLANLSESMAKSEDRVVRALGGVPLFRDAIYEIQKEHWDPIAKRTVSPERALKLALKGAPPLLEEARAIYSRLHEAFGPEETEEAEAPPAAKPAPKPVVKGKPAGTKTGPSPKPSPSPPPDVSKMSDAEVSRYWTKRLAEAGD
jgi:hypothetical protein